uniref:ARAD1D15620p n=1 Tax=Blastobotrys adeninivorans TaxID=409370 RepID=A0A060T932_BLAAD
MSSEENAKNADLEAFSDGGLRQGGSSTYSSGVDNRGAPDLDVDAEQGPLQQVQVPEQGPLGEIESDFVQKYGPVKCVFFDKPPEHPILTRPHALNYFFKGVLHRSKGERGSGQFELFIDLLYVGIVANLAATATEEHNGLSLLRYVLTFLPAWQVWSDLRDFMNYYYNNDLTQKALVLWILALLVVYANNASKVAMSSAETALVVGPYVLARFTMATVAFLYTFVIHQHRRQMRFYAISTYCTCALWLAVIWINVRAKVAVAFICLALEIGSYAITFHPWFKKLVRAKYSTAVNIEHEVERVSAFFIIALGESLLGIVQSSPAPNGFTLNLARAIMTLIISYCFLWLYFNGEGSEKAVHALRRSVTSAFLWVYVHIPIMGGLILASEAAVEMTASNVDTTKKHPHTESSESESAGHHVAEAAAKFVVNTLSKAAEHSSEGGEEEVETHYSLQFFFTGGLCVSLLGITIMALADKSMDPKGHKLVPPIIRLVPRAAIAIIILCLAFAEMQTTLLLGITALLLVLLVGFETVAMMPRDRAPMFTDGPPHPPIPDHYL